MNNWHLIYLKNISTLVQINGNVFFNILHYFFQYIPVDSLILSLFCFSLK